MDWRDCDLDWALLGDPSFLQPQYSTSEGLEVEGHPLLVLCLLLKFRLECVDLSNISLFDITVIISSTHGYFSCSFCLSLRRWVWSAHRHGHTTSTSQQPTSSQSTRQPATKRRMPRLLHPKSPPPPDLPSKPWRILCVLQKWSCWRLPTLPRKLPWVSFVNRDLQHLVPLRHHRLPGANSTREAQGCSATQRCMHPEMVHQAFSPHRPFRERGHPLCLGHL